MKPPRLARALARLFSIPQDRAFLLEDLAERFQEIAKTQGLQAARRWYWSQALSVVPWALRLLPRAILRDGDLIRRRPWAGVIGEVRLGLRTVRQRPLYAVGVAGTLALGLAAATITFAVAWSVWLAPMPYPDPDRVVRLYELEPLNRATGATGASQATIESRRHQLSPPLLADLRARSWRTIAGVSAVFTGLDTDWTREGETRSVSRARLSPEGFGILGIAPILGRLPADEAEVVLGESFWRAAFGADPDVVGSRMILSGQPRAVTGVVRLPSGYPGHSDIVDIIRWDDVSGDAPPGTTPIAAKEEFRGLRFIDAIARVRTGYSVADAKAEMNAFLAALGESHPAHRGWSMEVVVLADDLVRPFRGVLALLLAAGTIFLLLAGVNVLGLVAARRVESRHDRSIRLALGASEGRLLRGSLIESVVLAGVGSLAGVLTAYWLIGPIRALVPQDVSRLDGAAVTPPLVLSGLALGIAMGVVIGLAGYLVSRGVKASVGRAPVWRSIGVGGRRTLVVGQVALTTLMVAGGAAILHRVSTLRTLDLGFEAEGVSAAVVSGLGSYPSRESWRIAWHAILDGLRARGIPAAAGFNTPMAGDDVPLIGIKADAASEAIFYELHTVSADYFSVLGIELLAGRGFDRTDHASSMLVAIVSDELVDRWYPAGTPVERVLGRIIQPGPSLSSRTVVGVVESTRHQGPDVPVIPDLYLPFSQWTFPPQTLLVEGDPDQVAEAVSAVVAQVDPELRWTPLVPYTSHLKEWFAPLRLQIITIGVLGGLGLLLASLGLYSLMAYQVTTRRQELGIRKAVGATDGQLMGRVLTSGMTTAFLGGLIGLGAWYQLLPWTRELVDGIESGGYLLPVSVAMVVGVSCVLATLVPAKRAAQVDPVVPLRAD